MKRSALQGNIIGDIFIVDDNPDNLALLSKILKEHGHEVRVATSGKFALKVVEKSPPDLILLDILMPEMDGYETCRKIKENSKTRDIPVIFISALNTSIDIVKAFKSGGVDYINKPVEAQEMIARINTHLSIRRLQEEVEGHNLQLEEIVQKRTDELQVMNSQLEENIVELHAAKRKVEENEKQLQLIIDNSTSILLLLNEKGEVLNINQTGKEFSGHDDFAEKQPGDVFRCFHAIKTKAGCGKGDECKTCVIRNTQLDTITHKKTYNKIETVITTARNNHFVKNNILLSTIYLSENPTRILVVIDDITKIRKQEEIKSTLLTIYNYAPSHSPKEVMQKFIDGAEKITNSNIGFFHLVQEDQENVFLQAWSKNTLENMCQAEGEGLHYPISQAGVWVDCLRKREPVIHNNYETLKHKKGLPEGHSPIIRELVVPVIRERKIVAILGVGNKLVNYNDQDIQIVQQFADMAWETVKRKFIESEKIETNKRLKISEEKYRSVVESSNDGYIFVNNDFKIIGSNNSYAELIGHDEEEIIGQDYKRFLKSDGTDWDSFFTTLATKVDEKKNSVELETINYQKEAIPVEINVYHHHFENEELYWAVVKDLREKKKMESKIFSTMVSAEQNERARYAKELHDGLGPLLSTGMIYIHTIKEEDNLNEIKGLAERAYSILQDAASSVKEISNNLSPLILKEFGIAQAVRSFIEKIESATQIDFLIKDETTGRFDETIESTLYRTLVELINNSIKYSNAKNIRIQLDFDKELLRLEYSDDGIGFDYEKTIEKKSGFGLINLKNRVERLGGIYQYITSPRKGVIVIIKLRTKYL